MTEIGPDVLQETTLKSETVYEGVFLKVFRDEVSLPNGKTSVREFIRHPGACVILALTERNTLIFERQFRYPLGRSFYELPAGKIDADENILLCAQRELTEETGYIAATWQHLGTMHPCIGYSDERIEIFLARDLTPGEPKLDANEFLEVLEMSMEQAKEAVLNGKITDAKTTAALFWLLAQERL